MFDGHQSVSVVRFTRLKLYQIWRLRMLNGEEFNEEDVILVYIYKTFFY